MEGMRRAAGLARSQYRQKLDFSAESINALDEILVLVGEDPEIDLDYESRLWGSYLGEVLRRTVRRKLGDDAVSREASQAVPAVDVRGSRLFPLMKVYRRLTMGEEEDLRSFYNMVTERLGNPAQVN